MHLQIFKDSREGKVDWRWDQKQKEDHQGWREWEHFKRETRNVKGGCFFIRSKQ